jgi:peptidoglycan/xylan/chitin deacetylase (PgdA/CDA1 family)
MYRRLSAALAAAAIFAAAPAAHASDTCKESEAALGVSRIVEIDTASGPIYGDMTKLAREESFLGPKEVVLTFDDGPVPAITSPILDVLDQFCTKATFFSVGQMALAYPAVIKDVIRRGHTLGAHTWSHPLSLRHLRIESAKDQIDRGFAAVALAAGKPISPFFRFPGLSDSDPLLAHLQTRAIASFTVDVVSNDSYIGNPAKLTERVMRLVEDRQGGILLFHDIKKVTAKALPDILSRLKAGGYKVVHLRSKAPLVPDQTLTVELAPALARAAADKVATAEATAPVPVTLPADLPVTVLTPSARIRVAVTPKEPRPRATKQRSRQTLRNSGTRVRGWESRGEPVQIFPQL